MTPCPTYDEMVALLTSALGTPRLMVKDGVPAAEWGTAGTRWVLCFGGADCLHVGVQSSPTVSRLYNVESRAGGESVVALARTAIHGATN